MSSREDSSGIELVDLIDYVATQLTNAEARAQKRANRVMTFAECELELVVSIDKSRQGGLKVWVMELGGSETNRNTHTIRVKLGAIPGSSTAFFAGRPIGPPPKDDTE